MLAHGHAHSRRPCYCFAVVIGAVLAEAGTTQRARKASARKQLSGTPATPSHTTAASTKMVGSKDVQENGPVSRSRILSRAFRDPVALVAPRPQCHRRALGFSGSPAPYCIAWLHSLTHVKFSKAYLSAQPAGASVLRCTAGP